ncbi:MAG: ankyrin repeat domain-containing protein [Gammaproteobacteria bacterium]|nr:ankyrin repeat domain-containing protein [Gammaproteobacteria bacterium]
MESYFPTLSVDKINRKNALHHTSALFLSSSYEQDEVINMLLSKGANPDDGLWIAAAMGNIGLVKKLLDAGANPNGKNYQSHTALFYAAMYGQLETLKLLLSCGASPNQDSESSPLLMAVKNNHTEVAQVLLENNANPIFSNKKGIQAIHLASFFGNERIVKLLLQYGVKKTVLTLEEKTPLYFAILGKQKYLAEHVLLDEVGVRLTLSRAIKENEGEVIRYIACLPKYQGAPVYPFLHTPRFFQPKPREGKQITYLSEITNRK